MFKVVSCGRIALDLLQFIIIKAFNDFVVFDELEEAECHRLSVVFQVFHL